jgi:hypothetical protein
MSRTCLTCHFLAKEYREASGGVNVFSWSVKDRRDGKPKAHYTPRCWWGIWDAGINPGLMDTLDQTLHMDRRDTCFHVEVHEGMSFEAAKELQRRRQQIAELKRSNFYTRIGLWIAGVALLVSAIFQILNYFDALP